MKTLKRTWADISLDNLEHNYRTLRAHVGSKARFLGVMKADAYGHGAVPLSRTLEELGAEYFAVSNLEEAVQLRRGEVRAPILILGYTPPDYADNMVFLDIVQEVHSLSYAQALDHALSGTNYILNIHLKLDTGMTRLGFFADQPEKTLSDIVAVSKLSHLHIEGAFMHFCVADSKAEDDIAYTKLQYQRFTNMLSLMRAKGIEPEIRHCCNSGASILYPEYAMDMIRPGVATYGLQPSSDTQGVLNLKPVMSLHTCIAQIRTVEAEKPVSYGRTYVTPKQMRVAVLPIGYADGLRRALSNRASFRICGKEAKVLGRICMDMCMVDVTDIPDAQVGTTATLFGYDEDGSLIPCERIAETLNTISYEILCAVDKRVPRMYLSGGKNQTVLQYIV